MPEQILSTGLTVTAETASLNEVMPAGHCELAAPSADAAFVDLAAEFEFTARWWPGPAPDAE